MGWILRTSNDLNNPTLPGGIYGKWITAGRGAYWKYDGSRTRGILLISDGGRYGLDDVTSFEYKGDDSMVENTDWIFHRGLLSKQISPVNISAIDTGTDVLTSNGHPFSNTQLVRIGTINGNVPTPTSESLKYQISDVTTNTFKLKDEAGSGYINFTDAGSGQVIIWRANAGFDDPDQGLPTFVPEVGTTFSHIAYVEFKLFSGVSSSTEPPDWDDFRVIGVGRRMMDYDIDGSELGVISADADALSNVALEIADNAIVNYRVKETRFDWPSWNDLKVAADEPVWQRIPKEEVADTGTGFLGQYFDDTTFTNLVFTRADNQINYASSSDSPGGGITPTTFSVRWTAYIKPQYSEVYTLKVHHDDDVKLYVNGNLIIDKVAADGVTHTATYKFTANEFYDIQLDFKQATSTWRIELLWSSASQSEQHIPQARAYLGRTQIRRYECHAGFPTPVEASEVHERLMERVPGWDWTDEAGLIKFLPPDRDVSFGFSFDRIDDDSLANFVKQTLTKKRRPLSDRPNFLLFRFRNVEKEGFPFAFIQAEREELRDLTNGEPTNRQADDIGVATRGLAERMAEMQMVLVTDPEFIAQISGARSSSKLRKCHFTTVSYYDVDGNYVVDQKCMVTFHAWGASNSRNDFTLLPIPTPYYADEPYVAEDIPEVPTLNSLSNSAGTITGEYTINGGTGTIRVHRKLGTGGTYAEVTTTTPPDDDFTNTPGADGTYYYKLSQDSISGFSNEMSVVVSSGGGPTVPTLDSLSFTDPTVTGNFTVNGGTGTIRVHRKLGVGGSYAEVTSVPYTNTSFTNDPGADGTYYYKLSQDGISGFSNELSVVVDIDEGGTPPSNLSVTQEEVDLCDWEIHVDFDAGSGSGNYTIQRKIGSGAWNTVDDDVTFASLPWITFWPGNPSTATILSFRAKQNDVEGWSNSDSAFIPRCTL